MQTKSRNTESDLNSIKKEPFQENQFTRESELKKLRQRERPVQSEQISRKNRVSMASTKTEKGLNQPTRNGNFREIKASSRSLKKKRENEFEEVEVEKMANRRGNSGNPAEINFKEYKKSMESKQGRNEIRVETQSNQKNEKSTTSSKLNYTQTVLLLTESNASLLEKRNKNYNVFNTYCPVQNPRNIMTRKDRTRALRDLVQRDSTCSSGLDITILKSCQSESHW